MSPNHKPPYTSFNNWFLVPFVIWVLTGGLVQILLDRQTLFALFNGRHTPFLDVAMYYGTMMGEGVFSALVLLMLLALPSFRNWWYFAAALLSNVLPALFTQWMKSLVDAPRPLRFFNEATWIHTLPEWPRLMQRSFPSGHTTAAFSLFCFLAMVLTPRYKWAGVLFFCMALFTGITRMYLAAHFFIDVYVGSIIGVLFAILVLVVMQRYPYYFLRTPKRAHE